METYKKIRNEILESQFSSLKKRRLVETLDAINSYVDANDEAYVDQANLAIAANCKLTRIKKGLGELEELGYVECVRTKRSTDNRYHWNAYRLAFPPSTGDNPHE